MHVLKLKPFKFIINLRKGLIMAVQQEQFVSDVPLVTNKEYDHHGKQKYERDTDSKVKCGV